MGVGIGCGLQADSRPAGALQQRGSLVGNVTDSSLKGRSSCSR